METGIRLDFMGGSRIKSPKISTEVNKLLMTKERLMRNLQLLILKNASSPTLNKKYFLYNELEDRPR